MSMTQEKKPTFASCKCCTISTKDLYRMKDVIHRSTIDNDLLNRIDSLIEAIVVAEFRRKEKDQGDGIADLLARLERARINADVVTQLVSEGLDEKAASTVIRAVESGAVSRLKINYAAA